MVMRPRQPSQSQTRRVVLFVAALLAFGIVYYNIRTLSRVSQQAVSSPVWSGWKNSWSGDSK